MTARSRSGSAKRGLAVSASRSEFGNRQWDDLATDPADDSGGVSEGARIASDEVDDAAVLLEAVT